MADRDKQGFEEVKTLLERSDYDALRAVLSALHPADIAEILEDLENEHKALLLKQLNNDKAADVLTAVDDHSGQALLALLTDSEVVSILEEMPSDDAADLISTMPPEKSKQVDALLPLDERERIHELLEFDDDTAGGIMEVEKVAVREQATIRDAVALVRRIADDIENVQVVYVLDRTDKLIGSIEVLDLILHEPDEKVTDVMDEQVISVPVDMDQEEVANLFGKYDKFTLPVVDADGKLVGRITVDDIIDVLEEEASEDIARIAGTVEQEIGERSPLRISRARLPWLLFALAGQVINAWIMGRYALPTAEFLPLVFFVPLVIGTAGSTGMQAAIVVVREIAIGEISATRIWRRVFQELQVTFVNGVILGAILFGIVSLWQQEPTRGVLLWATLLSVTLVSAFLGALIPLLMKRSRIDPAIATGPFIAVMSDIIGLLIYMAFATYYVSLITS
jgi:magnesium transporter